MNTANESGSNPHLSDSDVTVAGFSVGSRRRVIIDLALIGTVFACIAGFMDMRAQTRAQTDAFRALAIRLDNVEARERILPVVQATKSDIDRLERRIERLQELYIETNGSIRRE